MVKVFFDADIFEEGFTDKLKAHSKVHYSKKFDSYLIRTEDYEDVFNELEFNKQVEDQTEDLINWDIKIYTLNDLIEVLYEQESVEVLRKEYLYTEYIFVELNEDLVEEFCTSDDWGFNLDEIVKVQVSVNISNDLSDVIKELKIKGFEIVIQ